LVLNNPKINNLWGKKKQKKMKIYKGKKKQKMVRDANCIHHFQDGVYSCMDYWCGSKLLVMAVVCLVKPISVACLYRIITMDFEHLPECMP